MRPADPESSPRGDRPPFTPSPSAPLGKGYVEGRGVHLSALLWAIAALCACTAPLASAPPPAAVSDAPALPFIEDDYPKALALAKERNVPLFADAWAPWCHSCRFMRAHVFTDAALAPHAGRFVWLSIDTELPRNLAFVERYPLDAWPTLFVIDPRREQPVLRWMGNATAAQLASLFDEGEAAYASAEGGLGGALTRARTLEAAHQPEQAARAYEALLSAAPPAAPERTRAAEALVVMRATSGAHRPCAEQATALAPSLPRGPSFLNVVASGLSCALSGAESEPWRAQALATLTPLAEEALLLQGPLADDRSGLYGALVEVAHARGDLPAARAYAERWLALLEAESSKAPSAERRAAFDSHRVSAALALGAPERAIPALQASEKALPQDYNPPARLALLYREQGQLDLALAACERALARVYGPRTLRVLETKASVELLKGDKAAARATYARALSLAREQPPAQRSEAAVARLTAALQKLE